MLTIFSKRLHHGCFNIVLHTSLDPVDTRRCYKGYKTLKRGCVSTGEEQKVLDKKSKKTRKNVLDMSSINLRKPHYPNQKQKLL